MRNKIGVALMLFSVISTVLILWRDFVDSRKAAADRNAILAKAREAKAFKQAEKSIEENLE